MIQGGIGDSQPIVGVTNDVLFDSGNESRNSLYYQGDILCGNPTVYAGRTCYVTMGSTPVFTSKHRMESCWGIIYFGWYLT